MSNPDGIMIGGIFFSPEQLEQNAIASPSIDQAWPWIARLDEWAKARNNKYWLEKVTELWSDFGLTYDLVSPTVGSEKNMLGMREPPRDLKQMNIIFKPQIDSRDVDFSALWHWLATKLIDNISNKYEWLAGLLFCEHHGILTKHDTPTSEYIRQLSLWFPDQPSECFSADAINAYRDSFFRYPEFSFSAWMRNGTVPSGYELKKDQSLRGFSNIKRICVLYLQEDFRIESILI